MMHRLLSIGSAASLLAVAASASSGGPAGDGHAAPGTIRGRVVIASPAAGAAQRPSVGSLGASSSYTPERRRSAVVYLEPPPPGTFEEGGPTRVAMSQRNETFVPHVLAVRVGTIVEFPNDDLFYHNVFSLSKAKRFDLGRYAKGQSKAVLFDEPGVVRVFCDIHSHMSAFVLVFAHRFFAVTDDNARYRIDRVPPGIYTLVVWYEGAVRQSRSVTVPADGGTVDVDFEVR